MPRRCFQVLLYKNLAGKNKLVKAKKVSELIVKPRISLWIMLNVLMTGFSTSDINTKRMAALLITLSSAKLLKLSYYGYRNVMVAKSIFRCHGFQSASLAKSRLHSVNNNYNNNSNNVNNMCVGLINNLRLNEACHEKFEIKLWNHISRIFNWSCLFYKTFAFRIPWWNC